MALKYWLEFTSTNVINDTEVEKIVHRVEILNDDYTGDPVQLYGYCSLVKSSTKDTLEPIRGGGLKIKLEAGLDLTLEDLYSENERTFKVTYTRGGQLEFIGWLSPEGLYRDFVADKWVISLDATDGLGFLSDLSYVENDTKQLFTGKQTLIEVISNCLKRTNLQQDIVVGETRLAHGRQDGTGLLESTLGEVMINTQRYIKDDKITSISCLDVLKSILFIFNMSITQKNGKWFIYKPNILVEFNSNHAFFNYDYNGVRKEDYLQRMDLNVNVGSSINNFYPYHVQSNQRITLDNSIGGIRLNYKYGEVASFFDNNYLKSEVIPPSILRTIDGWTILDRDVVSFVSNESVLLRVFSFDLNTVMFSDSSGLVLEGNKVNLTFSIQSTQVDGTPIKGSINHVFLVKLKLTKNNGGDVYMSESGGWESNSNTRISVILNDDLTHSFSIQSEPIPEDGVLTIEVLTPVFLEANPSLDIKPYFRLYDINVSSENTLGDLKGEIHDFTVIDTKNTKALDTKEVLNGDSVSSIFSGTLYELDGVTPTVLWYRVGGITLFKKLLQHTGENIIKMNAKPLNVFQGSVMGFVDYMSVVHVDGLNPVFLPTENYEYDAKENITKFTLKEILNDNIGNNNNDGINYIAYLDTGNVTKPTIR